MLPVVKLNYFLLSIRITLLLTNVCFAYKYVVIRYGHQLESGPFIVHTGCIDRIETASLGR